MKTSVTMYRLHCVKLTVVLTFVVLQVTTLHAQPKMEKLPRGLVAIRNSEGANYLSWRLLGNEVYSTVFNVYRGETKINEEPITDRTNFVDENGTESDTYFVTSIVNGIESEASEAVSVWESSIQRIDLDVPEGGNLNSEYYTYTPNDCSVGDLDGDGEYEIVLKWDPTNSKDNSQSGYTGNVYLDAYEIDGTKLWRIDLGVNIRAGAHYTQFMVYDLDSDGKAEVVCRTAPGTKDGNDAYLSLGPASSDDDTKDYRNSDGYNLTSPEYITLFNGETGAEVSTLTFEPARGSIKSWGDNYGNRGDRFLAGIAYLDGYNPSVIMGRGYYQPKSGYDAKCGVAAYSFDGSLLTNEWVFWANTATDLNEGYIGQGTHSLSVADVDEDGYDEIIYGSMVVDHDGTGIYSTGWGHGDALHVSDLDPDHPGLEVFMPHEEPNLPYGISFRDAKTGEIIWGFDASYDVGRGLAADIDPNYKGYECWASNFSLYSCKGEVITENDPGAINHIVYWDGDLLCELLDGGYSEDSKVMKYDYVNKKKVTQYNLSTYGVVSNNSTKRNPCLTADLWGDWREEIIMRSSDNTQLVIFNTTIESEHKIYCLMHDPVYRCAIAWQNTAYNQPPHPGYYLGVGMDQPTAPDINIVGEVAKSRFSLSSTVSGWGSVTPSSGSYLEGEQVTVTAIPDDGWMFKGWSGDMTSSNSSEAIQMTEDKKIEAEFVMSDPDGTNVYQAEKGYFSSGSVDTNHDGYTGTGFVNTDNAINEWVEFTVYAPYDGVYSLVLYYANGSTDDRAVAVNINGEEQVASLSGVGNGDWADWQTVSININLSEGENAIRFLALTSGGVPNLDKLELTFGAVQAIGDLFQSDEYYTLYSLCEPNNFELNINSMCQGNGQVNVVDMKGQIAYQSTFGVASGCNNKDVNLQNLNAGMYILVFRINENTKLVQKVVIK